MNRRIIGLMLIAAVLTGLVSCGGSSKPSNRLEEIRERGVLEVCTEPYFAPNEFIDSSKSGQDQYVGYDMELAKYIADAIGVDLKIVPLEFGAVLAGTAEGKYDLAISALAYSPARAEAMAMSKGYWFGGEGYGFLIREEDEGRIETLEDLQGSVIVTQSGSVQESMYNLYVGKSKEFKLVSSMTDGYLAVAEGKADACICSIGSARLYAEANGGLYIPDFRFDVSDELTGTRVAACLEGTEELIELVNRCIDEVTASGQMQKWHDEAEAYAKTMGLMD